MQAEVTPDTNTIATFCRAYMGSADDQTRARFIYLNHQFLTHNQTFWLPTGRFFYTSEPDTTLARRIQVSTVPGAKAYLTIGGRRLRTTT